MSLIINKVTKKFGNIIALNNVSIEIKDGEFIAILGPSGCGKTTLLRIIGGFAEPTSGTIKMGDVLYSDSAFNLPVEKRNLSMVFQSFALWPHMSVREHIEFPLKSKRNKAMGDEEKKNAVEEAISWTGLKKLADRLPGELSGGQKQRVALARAVVSKPDILLMDEPLSSLDAELKVNMRKEIQDLHKLTGATIIYVTHDQSEALAMANRIIIMKNGNIEQIGTPEEVYKKPKTEFVAVFVGKCNLVRGRWNQNIFYVKDTKIMYNNESVEPYFIQRGMYPVRPEQFSIERKGLGIEGRITNKQYNGREIHYTVKCEDDFYVVYEDEEKNFNINEAIVLVKKERGN
ncbi:ABC transporter ATP-binding protein [Geosporobacter ferrireducens]|uniref:Transporter n=1 Tax=Geosporobacter ferrireducens TaxID=1424294 RepID=A0A1D8GCT6_9FIRM|nr:ABC transporter ATP-binding protein [Geosporobacter ferrireducens]AOT68713.1 transporter [Geosporobacter ferrireducens]MTI57601.1 ABC transporter ATP-binding protein [Geosporobacter ferrireducens]